MVLHAIAATALLTGAPAWAQAPAPAPAPVLPDLGARQRIAEELARLAEWCSQQELACEAGRLVDEILFLDPRNRTALALAAAPGGDATPRPTAASPDLAALRARRTETGRVVAPLYLELFARKHRPSQNALYDVYLIRALEHDAGLAAPVFERTWQAAREGGDWSRARMLIAQGREFHPVDGWQGLLRDIDDAELREIRRQLVPGGTFTLKFPELGPTTKEDFQLMQMQVVLPADYDPDRLLPLYISLGGGSGNHRPNRLTEGLGFAAAGLLYPRNPRNLEQATFDPVTLWASYEPMLAKLERVLPNLHPTKRVVFGFSNGANAVTALVAFSGTRFMDCYPYLIIHEGGMYQSQWTDETWAALKSCSLFYSGGKRGSVRFTTRMHAQAVAHGVDADLLVFEGGHEMTPETRTAMREWIRRQVVD